MVAVSGRLTVVRVSIVRAFLAVVAGSRGLVDRLPDGRLRDPPVRGREEWATPLFVLGVVSLALNPVVQYSADAWAHREQPLTLTAVLQGRLRVRSVSDFEALLVTIVIVDVEGL